MQIGGHFMGELRVRIKFGEHEFEAEGSEPSIDRQLAFFRRLVTPGVAVETSGGSGVAPREQLSLEKILQIHGRIVSLRVRVPPEASDEALLLILLGQRQLLRNERVSGLEVMQGFRYSQIPVRRADAVVGRLAREADVIVTGQHRRRRYRLSSGGLEKAKTIAHKLIAANS